jgi:hypothetical protein
MLHSLLALPVFALPLLAQAPELAGATPPAPAAPAASTAPLARMPVCFVENTGQYDERCQYVAYNGDLTTFIAPDHLALQLTPREAHEAEASIGSRAAAPKLVPAPGLSYCNVFLRWEGARETALAARDEAPTRVN